MENKFLKVILTVAVIAITLASIIYFTRTVIDIGCAKTGTEESSVRRKFFGINCWSWERTFQLQDEVDINWK